jgi:hypothetical protein
MTAKRVYRRDQEFYSWSPIVTRPIFRWPDNARVALVVNLAHWDWEVPEGTPLAVSSMGGPEGIWTGNQPSFTDITKATTSTFSLDPVLITVAAAEQAQTARVAYCCSEPASGDDVHWSQQDRMFDPQSSS